ncbi:MAG: ElyC/SanA/YdcF family protein [Desulfobacteraceae bacterium]
MYVMKKIIGILLSPGFIVLFLLGYGLLKLTLTRQGRRRGWGYLALGILGFYFFTTMPLPNYLIRPLENQYPPITATQNLTEVHYIVVLSGGARLNFKVPATSQLEESSALRVAEAIRLFHLLSGQPTLIMTGGKRPNREISSGAMMMAFAQSQGVPAEKLVAETESIDTYSNAAGVKPLVQDAPFLLVTSATHLPRAMRIFQLLEMRPIPAPANFHSVRDFLYSDYLPSGSALTITEAAIHEYLGLAYLTIWPSRTGK